MDERIRSDAEVVLSFLEHVNDEKGRIIVSNDMLARMGAVVRALEEDRLSRLEREVVALQADVEHLLAEAVVRTPHEATHSVGSMHPDAWQDAQRGKTASSGLGIR